MRLGIAIWLLWVLCNASGAGQELPPVRSFEPDVYGAGSQNWMVSQDGEGWMYFANNQGLLQFDGQEWVLYPSPNETIIRSVLAHEGKIYTGSYMEFGYWTRQADGSLAYASISDSINDRLVADEQFWNILVFEDYVVFQSLHQFFLYDPVDEAVEVITPEKEIFKAFPTDAGLYFSGQQQQLFELAAGEVRPLTAGDANQPPIVHLWVDEAGKVMVQTTTGGTYELVKGKLVSNDQYTFLRGERVYSALELESGGRAFGTISNGLFLVDANGSMQYHIDQVEGMANNTVLSLYEDQQGNIWSGTDNGISCINVDSPLRKYTDNSGRLGTVYASAVHRGVLYLGSNQGLFARDLNSQEPPELIPGSLGQVWELYLHEDQLFCGHDAGTFLVNDRKLQALAGGEGSWTFLAIPDRPELLLVGNYYGISVLEKYGGQWTFRNRIEGFNYSTRYMSLRGGDQPEIYVSHEYRGVYGMRLDKDYRKVLELKTYDSPKKGRNAGLTGFRDSIYYYSRAGLFVLQDFAAGFLPAADLNQHLSGTDYISGRMTPERDRLWFFTEERIGYLQQGALASGLQPHDIPLSQEMLNAKSGYENITSIGKDSLLIGTADGYLVLLPEAMPSHAHEISLVRINTAGRDASPSSLPITSGEASVPYTDNSVNFRVSVPIYSKYFSPQFQYRLEGYQDKWSEWTTEAESQYSALPYGDYTFQARSRLGRNVSENTITYSLQIRRPWYASYPAIVLYLLGASFLVYLLHRSYRRYYERKQRMWRAENQRRINAQKRETELEVSRLQNEQLQKDVKGKSREVAISTMSLVKKNELLQEIRDKLLANQDPEKNIRQVLRTIDKNIDEGETWNLFRDAFENADREFFKKIKESHPQLTPNDLKLCAYLRLNLSSKEIAPLLNISVRSVEVKRYRLRKKMDLDHEAGLVEYIMGL